MAPKSRQPLYPQSILNHSELIKHLQKNNIPLSKVQLDIFYSLLHNQTYPTLSAFASWYKCSKGKIKKELPNLFIEFLETTSDFVTITSQVHSSYSSSDSDTTKLVIKLQDNHLIECVGMAYQNSRITLCVSSQVGCAMGCTFCATGTMGIRGNITGGEILEQMIHMTHKVGQPIRNIVYMGMGEPLNNYNHVLASIIAFKDHRRWSLRNDRITISTVGITPKILQLCRDLPQVNLALSLHAPNQTLRQEIVPMAKYFPLDKLMDAFRTFASTDTTKKRRKGMIEYVLIGNSPSSTNECAHQLGQLVSSNESNDFVVNLIPYNPTQSSESETTSPDSLLHSRPDDTLISEFKSIVTSYNVPCYVRRTFGSDIASACGQLVIDIEDIETTTPCSSNSTNKKKKPDITKRSTKEIRSKEHDDGIMQRSSTTTSLNLTWMIRPLTYATIIAATCCIVSTGMLLANDKKSSTTSSSYIRTSRS